MGWLRKQPQGYGFQHTPSLQRCPTASQAAVLTVHQAQDERNRDVAQRAGCAKCADPPNLLQAGDLRGCWERGELETGAWALLMGLQGDSPILLFHKPSGPPFMQIKGPTRRARTNPSTQLPSSRLPARRRVRMRP